MANIYQRGSTWWIRYRKDGQHIRISTKTKKKSEAQSFLIARLASHDKEILRNANENPRYLLTVAMERYFDEVSLKKGTITTYRYTSRVFTRLMGHLHLDEIDRRTLSDFVATRKRTKVTDATIRRDLAFLGSIFTMAVRWGWVDTSVVTKFHKKGLKESDPRTRFLTRVEFARLLSSASRNLKPILILAVETGLRKEELLGLTLESIDLQRRELSLMVTKTGRPRHVPLTPRASETIRQLLEDRCRPRSLFLLCKPDGSRIGNPRNSFNGACRRSGLTNFRFHDLRHTFASWFVQDGGDLYRLSRILGHASLQMTARYGHLRIDDLHDELERIRRNRSQERSHERQIEPERS